MVHRCCTVHFHSNVLAKVSKSKKPRVAAMLKAVHVMESCEVVEVEVLGWYELEESRPREVAKVVRDGYAETLAYTPGFLREHWRKIGTNSAIERLNREIRRHTRVVGTFPNGNSTLMFVTTRLVKVSRERVGFPPLSGCGSAGRVASSEGGLRGCRKVHKNLEGTREARL